MAPPPSYGDLDKQIRDLFNKGYNYSFWKLDCKSKTQGGIELGSSGTMNNESGKVSGFVEAKQKFWDNSLSTSEKWTIDRVLHSDMTLQDKLVAGLKLGLASSFVPSTGAISNKLKAAYGQDYFKVDADMNLTIQPLPVINVAAVLGYENFLFGYQTGFDAENISLTTNNLAVSYAEKEFVFHAALNNVQQLFCSVFYKATETIDVGAQVSWNSDSGEAKAGIGAKYQMDKDAAFRIKLNNAFQVGFGYQQKLFDGITIFLSSLLNVKDLQSNEHRIGASLELEV